MQLLLTAGRSIISVGRRPAGRAAQLGDVSSGLTAARHRRLAVVDDAPAMAAPQSRDAAWSGPDKRLFKC